jgi:hypothetical protein
MKQINDIAKKVAGFRQNKYLIYQYPYDKILNGFYFEKVRTNIYLWKFCQPLYVPSESIHFTFGNRLTNQNGNHIFDFSNPTTSEEILDIINKEKSTLIKDVITFYNIFYQNKDTNIYFKEALAFSLCYIDIQKAIVMLKDMISELDKTNATSWEKSIIITGKELIGQISSGSVIDKLEANIKENKLKMGI